MILKHKWLVISLVLAVFLVVFRYNHGIIQQDNYVGYAMNIPQIDQIAFFDSRLLPGLPILIYLIKQFTGNYYIAGYIVMLLSFIGSYLLITKITGSKLSILPLIFPPILLNLASLIDTELPFIFLTILGYFLIKNKKEGLAFLVIGILVWFRLAGFAVIAGVFVYYLLRRDVKRFLVHLPLFAFPVALLIAFNAHYFGPRELLHQLTTYEMLHPGRISVGLVQLGADLARAFRWHWYRIFFSGLAYIALFAAFYLKLLKQNKTRLLEFWIITGLYIFTLSVNLVPFLENLGRYLAPTIPFFWIIFYSRFRNPKILCLVLPLSALVVLL